MPPETESGNTCRPEVAVGPRWALDNPGHEPREITEAAVRKRKVCIGGFLREYAGARRS